MVKDVAPKVAAALPPFQDAAEKLGVFVDAAPKSLQIRWHGPDDVDYALGGITPEGQLKTMSVNWKPNKIGKIDLAHEYLARIAALIGGNVRRTENPKGWYVEGNRDRLPDAIDLLSRPDELLEIIRWYTTELSAAIEAGGT